MAESWKVAGTYFESCNCYAPCSCVCLSPPSEGDCALLVGWHIDQGKFGDVTLDGLNSVLFAYSPGHMLQTKWKVALYLDERGTPEQQEALGKIFSGQAGGDVTISNHPFTPVPGFAAVIGKSKRFRFTDHGFSREISDRNGFYSPFAYHG